MKNFTYAMIKLSIYYDKTLINEVYVSRFKNKDKIS